MMLSLIYKCHKHSTEKNKTSELRKKKIPYKIYFSFSESRRSCVKHGNPSTLTHHVKIFVQAEVWVTKTKIQHNIHLAPTAGIQAERGG